MTSVSYGWVDHYLKIFSLLQLVSFPCISSFLRLKLCQEGTTQTHHSPATSFLFLYGGNTRRLLFLLFCLWNPSFPINPHVAGMFYGPVFSPAWILCRKNKSQVNYNLHIRTFHRACRGCGRGPVPGVLAIMTSSRPGYAMPLVFLTAAPGYSCVGVRGWGRMDGWSF